MTGTATSRRQTPWTVPSYLPQVLVQDAAWEFTHASATDGSRKMVEGKWEVGRASVMHNGSKVFLIGGAMLAVEGTFCPALVLGRVGGHDA